MMQEFVRQNRRLLKVYWILAQILGWLLIVGPMMLIFLKLCTDGPAFIWGSTAKQGYGWFAFFGTSAVFVSFILPGFVALIVGQFIRYLSELEYHLGWLLRHGDKILYLYGFFLIAQTIGILGLWKERPGTLTLFVATMTVFPVVVKALILVGLGQVLNRVIPIIGESKTLV